jgi:hypothetical protein
MEKQVKGVFLVPAEKTDDDDHEDESEGDSALYRYKVGRPKIEDENDNEDEHDWGEERADTPLRRYADTLSYDSFLPYDPEITWDNLNNPIKRGSENRLICRRHLRGHDD